MTRQYTYKEPTTWKELFDALDAVNEWDPICDDIRRFFKRHNPVNITEAAELWFTEVGRTSATLGDNVVHWVYNAHNLDWSYEKITAFRLKKPTKKQLNMIRSLIRKDLKLAAREFPNAIQI